MFEIKIWLTDDVSKDPLGYKPISKQLQATEGIIQWIIDVH